MNYFFDIEYNEKDKTIKIFNSFLHEENFPTEFVDAVKNRVDNEFDCFFEPQFDGDELISLIFYNIYLSTNEFYRNQFNKTALSFIDNAIYEYLIGLHNSSKKYDNDRYKDFINEYIELENY